MTQTRQLMRDRGPEVVQRYLEGESAPSLAKEFRVSTGAITKALRHRGVETRAKKPRISPAVATAIRACYDSGRSITQVAEQFATSAHTVRRAIGEAGGATRKRGGFGIKPPIGAENPAWRGGRHLNRDGYVMVWLANDSPYAAMKGPLRPYVFEHRLVMAQSLDRPLLPTETVHHVNGDKQDNRLENLQLRVRAHGPGARYVCNACGSHDVAPISL